MSVAKVISRSSKRSMVAPQKVKRSLLAWNAPKIERGPYRHLGLTRGAAVSTIVLRPYFCVHDPYVLKCGTLPGMPWFAGQCDRLH